MQTLATSSTPQRKPRVWRGNLLVASLLLVAVTLGGAFRFVGLNWDDFTHMHPDERFLTLNVLANVGGALQFTPDQAHFPPLAVLARVDEDRFFSPGDVPANPSLTVGAASDTFSAEMARYWVGEERVSTYDAPDRAVDALLARAVDLVLVAEAEATLFMSSAQQLGRLDSTDLQRIRCQALYPETNGAGSYFDARCSPLNPHNASAGFYTYGTLPLFMAHFTSQFVQANDAGPGDFFDFQGGHLVWRALSAFFEVGTILLAFMIGTRLHSKWVGLLAAWLYAAAFFPIQLAHFGTVNAITGFFVALALYSAAVVQDRGRWWAYLVFGIALGAAVGSRINIAPLAGVVALAALVYAAPALSVHTPWRERQALLSNALFGVMLAAVVSIVTFRIVNPYAFVGPGFFGVLPNPRWLEDIASGSFGVSGQMDSPPNWQWLGRPAYIYPLKDMLLWGMGIALGVMAWFGWLWAGVRLFTGRLASTRNILLVVWILVYFAWMGRIWVMTMRYYLPLYAALAVLAAWAIVELWRLAREREGDISLTRVLLMLFGGVLGTVSLYLLSVGDLNPTMIWSGVVGLMLLGVALVPGRLLPRAGRAAVLGAFVLSFTVLWGLMGTNIYRNQLTRVQAVHWAFENIPGDFAMRVEGAPEETPLINIAIANRQAVSAKSAEGLLNSATRHEQGLPFNVTFTAPADGVIREVYAPHLADPLDDPEPEAIDITLAEAESGFRLASASLDGAFSRDNHVLGDAYTFTLDQPVEVEAGQSYRFTVETTAGGTLLSGGSVVLVEGDWDNRLTAINVCQYPEGITFADDPPPGLVGVQECRGRSLYPALVQSYDLAMSYPVDDQLMRRTLLNGLEVGDYIAITSNRFYDTLRRNRLRWPMSSTYYDALFAGELGFELVAQFDETFEFAGLRVSDQRLPTYDSSAILEEFEADEAFHVYDHPAVFIFRKTDAYNHLQTRTLLETIPLNQPNDILNTENPGAAKIGVVYWSSLEADQAPTGLLLPEEKLEWQRQGGTWSERFDSDSPLNVNQPLGIVVWWLVILVFGWVTWPLLFALFPGMADRGYGVSKFIGMLLIGYLPWVLAAINIPVWSQSGVAWALVALAALSAFFGWRHRADLLAHIRANWRRMLSYEVLMLVLFAVMLAVRATNPDLWHHPKGGEKPMDFAYFNAVLRSTVFPPYDPWYAGGHMNYYYFGFVIVGSPVLLLKMVPAFAYNLAIPTLFALTGMGAFSAAYNIAHSWRRRSQGAADEHAQVSSGRPLGNPWVAGLAALMLCIVLGNLDTLRVLGTGIARLGGYTQPQGIENFMVERWMGETGQGAPGEDVMQMADRVGNPNVFDWLQYEISHSAELIGSLARGTLQWIDGGVLPIGADRWYWGPSRVLAETPGVGGNAITEMPYFTFVYGDLHAHMIALPLLLFVIFFLYNEFVLVRRDPRRGGELALALLLGALSVGLIRATNTWDWPAFTILAAVGMTYFWWLRWGRFNRQAVQHFFVYVVGFLALTLMLVLPYSTWYSAIYNSVSPWQGGKTPIWAYYDIHGLFLFLIYGLLLWETNRWLRVIKVKSLRGKRNALIMGSLGVLMLVLVLLGVAMAAYQVVLIAMPLIVWIVPLFFRPGQSRAMRYVLVLIGFALALTVGVEFIVVDGDIGRQNTVFKFYMQAWVLFSVGSGVAFAWLIEHSERWRVWVRGLFYTLLIVLVTIAALFPVMATRARMLDRFSQEVPLTLNGLDYMPYAQHTMIYHTGTIQLEDDYHIIRWLQENVQGTPPIMEGRSAASEYTWTGRIAINTGLPAVLGWRFHQSQQRTYAPLVEMLNHRERNVNTFYTTTDISVAVDMLRHYDVGYIIVSGFERVIYPAEGLAKFEAMRALGLLERVHEQGGGLIYAVNQAALDAYQRQLFERQDVRNASDSSD